MSSEVPDQCQKLYSDIKQDGHTVDVLVNNAAAFGFVDFSDPDFDIESVRQIINTNLMAPIDLVKLFLPDLIQSSDGAIINVCSPAGRAPLKLVPMYSATKAGMVLLLKVDGNIMGSQIEIGKEVKISLRAYGTSIIDKIELVKMINGTFSTIYKDFPKLFDFTTEFTDTDFLAEKIIYYARMTQLDGERAWSSPVYCTVR